MSVRLSKRIAAALDDELSALRGPGGTWPHRGIPLGEKGNAGQLTTQESAAHHELYMVVFLPSTLFPKNQQNLSQIFPRA